MKWWRRPGSLKGWGLRREIRRSGKLALAVSFPGIERKGE